jgi:predicted phage-related endonuclease
VQVHNITQGTDQWRAHRAKYLNASDAPAMMACSPNMSRTDLVRQLALGIERDFSDYVQRRILDKGHQFEALARPMAEKIMGEELAPLVGTSGKYGASYDGQTMLGDRSWEHKRLNAALREAMFEGCTGADLPLCYQVQMEHQAMVADGTEQILFTASEWDDDGNIIEARHCWYTPNPELRAKIVAGWAQLEADVAAYVAPEPKPVPVVAAPMETLPAVSVRVDGQLAIVSNLPAFGTALRNFIDRIPTAPNTDQEFADTEAACKALKQTEDALEAAESNALGQLADVDTMRRLVADYRALARSTRLQREKLVAQRKEEIRGEIVAGGVSAFRDHIAALNTRLGKPYMPTVPADFAGVIKGKRTVESLRGAVNDELARAKIAANEIADRIQINLTTLRELASEHAFLFADTPTIVLKAADDLTTLVKTRIAEHEAAKAAQLEAERERIRAEEQARAQREAREAEAQRERERQEELRQQELQKARDDQAAIAAAAASQQLAAPVAEDLSNLVREKAQEAVAEIDAAQAISTAQRSAAAGHAVARPLVPTLAPTTPPSLKLGQIAERLGFALSADFLRQLGFAPAAKVGAHGVYHEADFPHMLAALVRHIESVQAKAAA